VTRRHSATFLPNTSSLHCDWALAISSSSTFRSALAKLTISEPTQHLGKSGARKAVNGQIASRIVARTAFVAGVLATLIWSALRL
jgi:hypothetical protein